MVKRARSVSRDLALASLAPLVLTLNNPVNPQLTPLNRRHNNLPLGAKPKPIINQLCQPRRQQIPQFANLAIHRQPLDVDVGGTENGTAGGFVAAAGFDADEAVFDNVDTADTVFAAELVEVEEEFEGVGFDWNERVNEQSE